MINHPPVAGTRGGHHAHFDLSHAEHKSGSMMRDLRSYKPWRGPSSARSTRVRVEVMGTDRGMASYLHTADHSDVDIVQRRVSVHIVLVSHLDLIKKMGHRLTYCSRSAED